MKKLISIVLLLVITLSATACSQESISSSSSIKENLSQNNTSNAEPGHYFVILTQDSLNSWIKYEEDATTTSEGSFSGRYLVDENPESRVVDVLDDFHKGIHKITWESDAIYDKYCPFHKAVKENFPFYNQQIETILIDYEGLQYSYERKQAFIGISYNESTLPITENPDFAEAQKEFYAPLIIDESKAYEEIVNYVNGAGIKYAYFDGKPERIYMLIDNWCFDFDFSSEDYEMLSNFTEKETVEKFIADVREIAENEFYDYR